MIDAWPEAPGGHAVTLSPLAAERLGVTLVLSGNAEVLTWSYDAASIRHRRPSAAAARRTEDRDRAIQESPDPRPAADPAAAIDRLDSAERRRRGTSPIKVDDLPKPTILLWGHALWPWYGDPRVSGVRRHCEACRPKERKRKGARSSAPVKPCRPCGLGLRPRPKLDACPGCRDRPLMRNMYCLRCDRWGWDGSVSYLARLRSRLAAASKRKAG